VLAQIYVALGNVAAARASIDAVMRDAARLAWSHGLAEGAVVDLRAHLGRWVAVGRGASIGPGAQVDDCVLHEGARVGAGARVTDSVLAANATIGEGAIVGSSVLGEGSSVPAGAQLADTKVPSGTVASSS